MITKRKGLICYIYSSGDECVLNAVKGKTVLLVGSNIPEIFEESENHPAVEIIERNLSHMDKPYKTAYLVGKRTGACFGGRFIYSSDSRFRAVAEYPVPLHDRYEG